MRAIGIRELRQQASRYLQDVQRGETIQVTDRGHPVAWLVPVPENGGVQALVTSGRLVPAAGDALDLGLPLQPAEREALPSEAVARARSDER